MTEVDRLCLRYAGLAGRLAAAVEWCVQHGDERLNDHPVPMAQAREALAEAILCRSEGSSDDVDRLLADHRESTERRTAGRTGR